MLRKFCESSFGCIVVAVPWFRSVWHDVSYSFAVSTSRYPSALPLSLATQHRFRTGSGQNLWWKNKEKWFKKWISPSNRLVLSHSHSTIENQSSDRDPSMACPLSHYDRTEVFHFDSNGCLFSKISESDSSFRLYDMGCLNSRVIRFKTYRKIGLGLGEVQAQMQV